MEWSALVCCEWERSQQAWGWRRGAEGGEGGEGELLIQKGGPCGQLTGF